MARIIILGSAAAVADAEHDNTHFLIEGEASAILVDCGSNPLGKLHRLGIADAQMRDVILTHFHPDHVAGFPNMLMQMWLLGRKTPMRVFGLQHCLHRIEATMVAYAWETWPNFFPIEFIAVPEKPYAPVLETDEFHISAFPAKHFVPTISLRVLNKKTGKVLAYTCDTEPIPSLITLARDADILIHEAAGVGVGHSSAEQAGECATASGARSLVLIHYQVWNTDPAPLVDQARAVYSGPVALARDWDTFEF